MKSTKKKLANQSKIIKDSFTRNYISVISGINTVAKYANKQDIKMSINTLFLTERHCVSKFAINQDFVFKLTAIP
jgi:hypothetical protein